MKRKFCLLLSIFCLSLFTFSCASSKKISENWKPVTNLSDLYGFWSSPEGEYSYPFVLDGKKYLRFSFPQTEDTQLWKDFAAEKKLPLQQLWEKRFSLAACIYSSGDKKIRIPDSDENDIQTGRKFSFNDDKIYSQKQILIPERLLAINLAFFAIRDDGQALKENKIFYLASDKFPDIKARASVYMKVGAE